MPDPIITGYLADVAANVTVSILGAWGAACARPSQLTPRQKALERCYQAALAAWLPADDPLSKTYQPHLEAFLDEPAVTAEFAKLVRGRAPDQQTLVESFAEFTEGRGLPPFDFSARLGAGVEAFLQVAEREPELAETIQTAQLRDATQLLRAMATDVNAIRQAVEVARPSTGDVTARGDIHARNLVTGTQINHIVHVYRAGGGIWDEADYRAALDRYLDWLAVAMGRVVLRGIKSGGQQAIELSLDEIYVPLAAEALPEARETLKRSLGRSTRGGRRSSRSCRGRTAGGPRSRRTHHHARPSDPGRPSGRDRHPRVRQNHRIAAHRLDPCRGPAHQPAQTWQPSAWVWPGSCPCPSMCRSASMLTTVAALRTTPTPDSANWPRLSITTCWNGRQD